MTAIETVSNDVAFDALTALCLEVKIVEGSAETLPPEDIAT